jgi:hypothetical protein
MPNTIAAMKPNDRTAASTFSRIESSIVASIAVALTGDSTQHDGGSCHSHHAKSANGALPSGKVFALRQLDRFLDECDQTSRTSTDAPHRCDRFVEAALVSLH